jgi:hypothetical protein
MGYTLRNLVLGCFVGALIGLFAIVSGTASANVWIKKDEVPASRSGDSEPRVIIEFYNPDAPDIIVKSPELWKGTVPTPVKVEINFVPKHGVEIDLSSVKLLYVTFFQTLILPIASEIKFRRKALWMTMPTCQVAPITLSSS